VPLWRQRTDACFQQPPPPILPEPPPDSDASPEPVIWPKPGDRLGVRTDSELRAIHTDILENGKRLLRPDEVYILKTIEPDSQ
jgi:hypothetical protein